MQISGCLRKGEVGLQGFIQHTVIREESGDGPYSSEERTAEEDEAEVALKNQGGDMMSIKNGN